MHGKTQESGLTEILPLICTSAIWGQDPVLSPPEFPQGAPSGVGGMGGVATLSDDFDGGHYVSILSSLRAHHLGCCNEMA